MTRRRAPPSPIVLVVEDNPITRRLVVTTLQSERYQVVEAADGRDAIARFSERTPDVVLLDLGLPDLSGFEVLGHLRALPGGAGVPVIAFSGMVGKLEAGRAAAAGFNDVLIKPASPTLILQVVRVHLEAVRPGGQARALGRRILLVDDDPVQLKLMEIRLSQEGYGVTALTEPTLAVEAALRAPPDLVLSDVLMPELDGFRLALTLRRHPRLSGIPVVLVSSKFIDREDRRLAEQVGASAYVARTPALAELLEAVHASLERPVPPCPTTDAELPPGYVGRMINQLERQVTLNQTLSQRVALRGAELAVLGAVARSLAGMTTLEEGLRGALASCLDAGGVSLGLIFLTLPDGSLAAAAQAGVSAASASDLCSSDAGVFIRRVIEQAEPIALPATGSSEEPGWQLLAELGVRSALLIPLRTGTVAYGALLLGEHLLDQAEPEFREFAVTVGSQLSQGLAMDRTVRLLKSSEERYRALFEANPHPMWVFERQSLRFLAVNDAATEVYGYSREELLGMTVDDIRPASDIPRLHEALRDITNGSRSGGVWRHRTKEGLLLDAEIERHLLDYEGKPAVLVLVKDVTQRLRAERRLAVQYAVTQILAGASSLESATPLIFQQVGELMDWDVGGLWMRDQASKQLRYRAVWQRAGRESPSFTSVSENVALSEGEELPGRALQSRTPVWTAEFQREAGALRAAAATQDGLHSGFCMPILANDRVIAIAEFMSHDRRPADPALLATQQALGIQVGQFVERSQAEEAQHRAESRLRHLISASSTAIYALRIEEGQFEPTWVSENIKRLTGFAAEEALSYAWWHDHVHPDDRPRVLTELGTLPTQGSLSHEYRLRRADGSYIWILDESRFFAQGEGQPGEAIGSWTDITNLKEVEARVHVRARQQAAVAQLGRKALEEQELPTLLNHAAVLSAELLGVEWCEVVELLPGEKELVLRHGTGWRKDALGLSPIASGVDSQAGYTLETRRPVVVTDYARETRFRPSELLRSHGAVSGMSVVIQGRDRPLGVLGIHSARGREFSEDDVNFLEAIANIAATAWDRRRLEDQYLHAQKMEAVGRLAGGVAHDFNNLLTAIIGNAEVLHSDLRPEDPLRAGLEEIQEAGQRAAELTHQLLAFSRQQVLSPKVVQLNQVVANMDRMLRRLLGEDIDFSTRLADNLGALKADPGQVEQIIVNLAVNARDAMPDGGKLTIETRNADIDVAQARELATIPAGRYVMLALSDTGSGMDAETRSHIFEPFFTTKEQGKGTGLGLSTVYGIVKQSEGFVWVYSELGKGTTFRIYFPRVEASASQPASQPALPVRKGSETVLLVEDEDIVRGLAARILVRGGYRVLMAPEATTALRLAGEHLGNIHLLMTDVVMPGMGGPELATRLKAVRSDLKVLLSSGYTDRAAIHRGDLEPGTAFLEKPFTPDGLLRKVREVLDA